MFGVKQDELAKSLHNLARRLCAYGPESNGRCDCKFGVPEPLTFKQIAAGEHESFGGEHNGCPEVSQAVRMVEAMTEEEFADFCTRSKVLVVA